MRENTKALPKCKQNTAKTLSCPFTDKDPPYFKIDLSGAFYSYERDDFSPYCTEELGSVMESKAQSMISPVNSRIGVEFCLDKTTADILVISTASTISTSGMEVNSFTYT